MSKPDSFLAVLFYILCLSTSYVQYADKWKAFAITRRLSKMRVWQFFYPFPCYHNITDIPPSSAHFYLFRESK
nr:MAG TPA: hypothetical protein [Caudoviricetes sp.]